MSVKKRTRVILAIALSLLSAALVYFVLAGFQPTQTVLVVAREIPPRSVITSDMLKVQYVDPNSLAVLASDAYTSLGEVENQVAVRALRPGEVLRKQAGMTATVAEAARFSGKGAQVPLSNLVPPGMRAVTIPLEQEAVFKIGDRVDLFATIVTADRRTQSSPLLNAVEVFLADDNDKSSVSGRSLTVLVREGMDVGRLVEARRAGKVDVVLAPVVKP